MSTYDLSEQNEPKKQHPVPALLGSMGIDTIKTSDEFSITYKNGILKANVQRTNGLSETVIKSVKGNGFSQMTTFEPNEMTTHQRNNLIQTLYKQGNTQKNLSEMFGLSQAMISIIVNS